MKTVVYGWNYSALTYFFSTYFPFLRTKSESSLQNFGANKQGGNGFFVFAFFQVGVSPKLKNFLVKRTDLKLNHSLPERSQTISIFDSMAMSLSFWKSWWNMHWAFGNIAINI